MTDANTMDEMEPRVEDAQPNAEDTGASDAPVVTDANEKAEGDAVPVAADSAHDDAGTTESAETTAVSGSEVAEAPSVETTPVEETAVEATPVESKPVELADDDDDEEEDIPHLARISFDEEEAAAGTSSADAEEALMEPAEDPEIPLELIDHDALWVVRRLRAKGYEAYLTGGCVRDLLLGRQPKDFDVATAAHPEQVRKVFRNCRLIGRRFRLAHVYFPNGKVIETATFRANPLETQEDLPEDLLVERDNVFGSVEEDARRRDLTINGLFYDPLAGKVLDFVDGRQDLEARLIRTIGDPDIRFQEDPVRILRAIKFATRLDFDFETQTLAAMRAHVADLARCAAPRLLEELHRLLSSGNAANAFRLCEEVGVLDVLVPELTQALRGDLDLARYAYGTARHEDSATEEAFASEASEMSEEMYAGAGDDEDTEATDASAASPEPVAFEAPSAPVEEIEAPPVEIAADESAPQEEAVAAEPEASAEAEGAEPVSGSEIPGAGEADPTDAVGPAASTADENTDTEAEEGTAEAPADAGAESGEQNNEPVILSAEERHARYTALLASLDQVHAREAELSSAVSFAAILLSGFEAYRSAGADAVAWLDEVTGTWTERIRLTRHDRETIRYLCRAMAQLDPALRRGAKARHLVSRPWFREALLLHTLSLHAAGQSLEEVARWKVVAAHYQKPFKQPKKGERQPRPRRMRRSRRGGGENRRGRRR